MKTPTTGFYFGRPYDFNHYPKGVSGTMNTIPATLGESFGQLTHTVQWEFVHERIWCGLHTKNSDSDGENGLEHSTGMYLASRVVKSIIGERKTVRLTRSTLRQLWKM